ncbi:hypothetical protein BN439_2532 [Erwinia amylovora Ea644]|uniref:OspG family effector kinase n=2 Tax=Erwinia amylovora TaxID=552 RepID=UPI0002C8F3EC|nr:protein kinase family protein [Erwinia amylovora]CCP03582.1 hypothetical protein BN439_2532 [Erwinia amylovora Ea644]
MPQSVQQNRSAVGNDQNYRAVKKKSVPSSKKHIGRQPADLVNCECCAFCTQLKIVAYSPASLQSAQLNSSALATAFNVIQLLANVSAAPQSDQQKWCPDLYSTAQSIEYRRHCPMRLSAQVTRKPDSFAIENKNAVAHNKSVRAVAAHPVIVASNRLPPDGISTSSILQLYYPTLIPGVDAAPVRQNPAGFSYKRIDKTYRIEGDQAKIELINLVTNYLANHYQLTTDEIIDLAFSLNIQAAGEIIMLIPLNPQSDTIERIKRISEKTHDDQIENHIKVNCAYEEELLGADGNRKGKLLLFQAQPAENPFRMIYDNNDGRPSPEARGAAEGLNFVTDIMTLGIKPLIAKIVANAKRETYQREKGDEVCAKKYSRVNFSELALSLTVDGFSFTPRNAAPKIKSSELINAKLMPERAAYFTQAEYDNSRSGIMLKVEPIQTSIVDQGREIYLKPTAQDHVFVTDPPHAVHPERLERRVIVDEKDLTWRYADDLGKEVLNVEIREGKKYITVQGDWYELQLAKKGQYEIFIPTDTVIKNYVPVYMEPLSRTWHMSVHNGHPVFRDKHQRLLTRISQEADPNTVYVAKINNNPRVYGPGKTYHAVKSSQASAHGGQNFVEMNGKRVPVRHPHGDEGLTQYEAFNPKRPQKKGHALAWHDDRWIFEQANSVHASLRLRKKITSAMFVKEIDTNTLTAPDRMGLRWSADGKAYLKVKKNFIQLRQMNDNRYAIRSTPHSHKMILRFRGNQFFPESIAERLKNIRTVGLSGRKRPHPVDVLKRQDGFDVKSAKELLSEYKFPENGLFDAYTFVLDIEQNGRIPHWAEKFKKRARLDMTPPDDSTLVKLHKPGEPDKEKHFYLGEELGEGKFATVYADATNKYFVVKRYDAQEIKNMPAIVNSEVENFTRYYGKDTAKIFIDSEGIYHVRMYRVSGETLDSLPPNSLPENAVEKYVDMLEELNAHGIFHDDLHTDNLIWDKNTERFYPIDIKNNKEVFFNSSPKDKDILNSHTSENWEYTLRLIREKQIKAAV